MKAIKNTFGLLALSALVLAPAATADQVILDDLIVDGSICVGFDCVNGESFGFDTLRLKENNLRIRFVDTSTSASFPSNDWQLVANDTSNGGANRFSIEDIDGARIPFTIEAGAPTHSLFVDDGGRLGLGTGTPVVEVHIKDGDTPTLRLEQDGSSGFTPQTWDVAGNETNFFIRDVTNGSKLPFRIRPNAPTSSIDVAGSSGNVGLSTSSPSAPLHVRRTNDTARLLIQDTGTGTALRTAFEIQEVGGIAFRLTNTDTGGVAWDFRNVASDDNFVITTTTFGGPIASFDDVSGDLTVAGVLRSSGPTCAGGGGCDDVFLPDYELPSIEEHAAEMWGNGYLPAVGPTPPNAQINVSDKLGRMLNELEKAHIYIEQLHNRLIALEAELASNAASE